MRNGQRVRFEFTVCWANANFDFMMVDYQPYFDTFSINSDCNPQTNRHRKKCLSLNDLFSQYFNADYFDQTLRLIILFSIFYSRKKFGWAVNLWRIFSFIGLHTHIHGFECEFFFYCSNFTVKQRQITVLNNNKYGTCPNWSLWNCLRATKIAKLWNNSQ